MNLSALLAARAESRRPVRVGLLGAGKFGSMFLSRALRMPSIHLAAVADLKPDLARSNLAFVGWEAERINARSIDEAARDGTTHVGEDWHTLTAHPAIDIIVECTGNPIAAVEHCLAAITAGKAVVNVTVEADALCGLALAQRASAAGVVYSMAYGDQPALAAELVDWARACGFPVVAAGRGHKWLPHFRCSTPDTVWDHWGLSRAQAERGRLNPKMFNAFLDGSKPAIESAAIANACGLDAPADGLSFPPGSIEDIPRLMRPRTDGGILDHKGMVDVVSSLTRDGAQISYDIRKGVWVCIEADSDYVRHCFEEYNLIVDPSGRYAVSYKRWHLIGLELPITIASVALRGEPTGAPRAFRADVAARAKRDLAAGEVLDGEGGATVSGWLLPAERTVRDGLLPLGLAHGIALRRPVADGNPVRYQDVAIDDGTAAFDLRREMERNLAETI